MALRVMGTASRIDPQEKAEAFAAWERYRDRLEQYMRKSTDLPDDVLKQRRENPLHALLFADGYLMGKRDAEWRWQERVEAMRRQLDHSASTIERTD